MWLLTLAVVLDTKYTQSKPITTSLKFSAVGRSLSKRNRTSVKRHALDLDRDPKNYEYHAKTPGHWNRLQLPVASFGWRREATLWIQRQSNQSRYKQLLRLGTSVYFFQWISFVCHRLPKLSCTPGHYTHLSSLQRIILTLNRIDVIPFPNQPEDSIHTIKYLSLSNNLLNAWSDIDALSCWFPALETLTVGGNPLADGKWSTSRHCKFKSVFFCFFVVFEDTKLGKHSRPFIIARIPSLLTLDGATVSNNHNNNQYMIIEWKRILDISQRTNRFRTFLHVNYHATRANIRRCKTAESLSLG